MKRMVTASLALATLVAGGPVWAADLAYKAPPPPFFSWTGCYIGVEGGGGAQFDSFTGKSGIGGFAGGQAGCNYQIHNFVVGLEGEGLWSDIRSRSDLTVLTPGGASFTSSETNRSFFDVAVRFGFTPIDRTLIYAKLGGVWSNQVFTLTSNTPSTVNGSWVTPGVLIGGGLEYAITNNWIARFETDLMMFDSTDATFATTGGLLPTNQTVNTMNIIAKLGISYKF